MDIMPSCFSSTRAKKGFTQPFWFSVKQKGGEKCFPVWHCSKRVGFIPLEISHHFVLLSTRLRDRRSHYKPTHKSPTGFTLVEVLIVIAISAMLSTIVLVYSGVSRNEISLSVETAKVSQFMFQAKTLALATTRSESSQLVCGYGVYFNYAAGTYSIFGYSPSGVQSCPIKSKNIESISPSDEMVRYSDATWNMKVANGVVMRSSKTDSLAIVLFYPPDPKTLISCVGSNNSFTGQPSNASIYLSTVDGAQTQTISVNSVGQITF